MLLNNFFSGNKSARLFSGALALLFAGMVFAVVSSLLAPSSPRMKQVVHEIALLPPPPPLPQIEQPAPPEVKEEMNIPEPETASQDDAPPGDLGLDSDGTGSDGFQLRARKGGRDLLGAGGPFAWYAERIQESIYKILSANKKVRGARYAVKINLWLSNDGRVERFELANTTGNPELDQNLRNVLSKVEPFGSELPADLPQPVRLKIVSRN